MALRWARQEDVALSSKATWHLAAASGPNVAAYASRSVRTCLQARRCSASHLAQHCHACQCPVRQVGPRQRGQKQDAQTPIHSRCDENRQETSGDTTWATREARPTATLPVTCFIHGVPGWRGAGRPRWHAIRLRSCLWGETGMDARRCNKCKI